MKCPICNAWTELLETRKRKAGAYRRYECANLHRFSTLNGELMRIDQKKRGAGRPPTRDA
jgi:transcriptional regulator NrdR family protein